MAIEHVTRVQEIKNTQVLNLTNRESLNLSGVNDVLNFSDTQIELDTNMGLLLVKGDGLKIISISTEHKTAELCGRVSVLEYKKQREKKSFIANLLK
ncbi:MAG: YabP/YqfC family sporulation protein [Clostridia bacterium]|nr:YabP/YqfC family sporulation protein [Clostridia bacterium]